MHDAFRLSGRARGVEHVEHVLRVHGLGLVLRRGLRHDIVVDDVASLDDVHVVIRTPDHQYLLNGRRALKGLVGGLLQLDDLPAPVTAVGCDQHLALRVVDPVPQRFGGKTAEDDRVGRADASACQHRGRQFRNHRHVDGDSVAFAYAEVHEHVGEPADLLVEILVGDCSSLAVGLSDPVVGNAVGHRGGMPVDTVVGGVELSAEEPLLVGWLPFEDGVPLLEPVETLGLTRPPAVGVFARRFVYGGIVEVRLLGEVFRWFEGPALLEQRLDSLGDFFFDHSPPLFPFPSHSDVPRDVFAPAGANAPPPGNARDRRDDRCL